MVFKSPLGLLLKELFLYKIIDFILGEGLSLDYPIGLGLRLREFFLEVDFLLGLMEFFLEFYFIFGLKDFFSE